MTREDIIRMAKECGNWSGQTVEMNDVGLERFAKFVAAAIERLEQPVECMCGICKLGQRQWQGLTDEDREDILRWIEWKEIGSQPVAPQKLIAYVEKKLKERNK